LGIAIQQTFGIGLGFNFDHMSKLQKGEAPTTRRLQARAAKSALRRAQQLYDTESAKEILDSIGNETERNIKAIELRNNVDAEIQQLAQRLTDLVPNDLSLDNRYNTNIQEFDSSNFERTSSNEYIVKQGRRTKLSPALDKLIKNQQSAEDESIGTSDYLNPFGANTTEEGTRLGDKTEEEFIDEWLLTQNQADMTGSHEKSNSTLHDYNDDDQVYLA
jgi:hypothetical protein